MINIEDGMTFKNAANAMITVDGLGTVVQEVIRKKRLHTKKRDAPNHGGHVGSQMLVKGRHYIAVIKNGKRDLIIKDAPKKAIP